MQNADLSRGSWKKLHALQIAEQEGAPKGCWVTVGAARPVVFEPPSLERDDLVGRASHPGGAARLSLSRRRGASAQGSAWPLGCVHNIPKRASQQLELVRRDSDAGRAASSLGLRLA